MAILAIADLHLDSGGKPMNVFGNKWDNHAERIFSAWREVVMPDDLVLIPGDLSWAMRLLDARLHLEQIHALPGTKLILRGNHDYWWNSIGRVRDALPGSMFAIQNDSFSIPECKIAGTRGWLLPMDGCTDSDAKIYQRELIRLKLSLDDAKRNAGSSELIAMMHYPPLTADQPDTGFTRLLREYGVTRCAYGHLHGAALKGAVRGEVDGVKYYQVSSDGIDFCPIKIL